MSICVRREVAVRHMRRIEGRTSEAAGACCPGGGRFVSSSLNAASAGLAPFFSDDAKPNPLNLGGMGKEGVLWRLPDSHHRFWRSCIVGALVTFTLPPFGLRNARHVRPAPPALPVTTDFKRHPSVRQEANDIGSSSLVLPVGGPFVPLVRRCQPGDSQILRRQVLPWVASAVWCPSAGPEAIPRPACASRSATGRLLRVDDRSGPQSTAPSRIRCPR